MIRVSFAAKTDASQGLRHAMKGEAVNITITDGETVMVVTGVVRSVHSAKPPHHGWGTQIE